MLDVSELRIHTLNQARERQFNLILHGGSLNGAHLAGHIHTCFKDGRRDVFLGCLFISGGLLLLSANNMLDCFGELRNVAALYVFADLCCTLQLIKVRILV